MRNNLVILMYHSVGSYDNSEIGKELYCVSERRFKEQMQYLFHEGYIGLQKKLKTESQRLKTNNDKIVILTFDDGDLTNYQNIFPILKDLRATGHFLILVSKIGTPCYMNWEQIRNLKDAGMIIGSHGMTHRILTELEDEDLDYELRESKNLLEDDLRQPVDYFSIPRGFYNKKIINKAKQFGYKAVFTSNMEDTDGFRFGRIPVKEDWNLEYFIRVLNNGFSLKDKTEGLIKNSLKKILKVKNYDRLRTWILKK